MKVSEAINRNLTAGMISCGIDTEHKTERRAGIEIYPDATISVGNKGCIHNGTQGMHILIDVRHNGSEYDMQAAFEDAKLLLERAIF